MVSSDHKFPVFDGCFDSDAQILAVLNTEMVQKYANFFLKVHVKGRLQHDDFALNKLVKVTSEVPEFVEQLEAVLNRKRFLPPTVRGSFDLCTSHMK
jgi:hypothetical protein